jgi:hypothetical protein
MAAMDIEGYGAGILTLLRLPKYGRYAPAWCCGISSSHKSAMTPSSHCRTSYTRTLLGSEHWCRLEHTIWTVSGV